MGGRGRGRGRGQGSSFTKEQLSSIGFTPGEVLPGPVSHPPPLYPLLENRALPLQISEEPEFMLASKQKFLAEMQSVAKRLTFKTPEAEVVKLFEQFHFDWASMPTELRPKIVAKKCKIKVIKPADINAKLDLLEKIESKTTNEGQEAEEVNEDEEEVFENEDEEMDEGTDYAQNYFDNGEGFEDEDETLEDGPVY